VNYDPLLYSRHNDRDSITKVGHDTSHIIWHFFCVIHRCVYLPDASRTGRSTWSRETLERLRSRSLVHRRWFLGWIATSWFVYSCVSIIITCRLTSRTSACYLGTHWSHYVNRVPASAGGKGWNVTSAGWQVTPFDPIWHVNSSSGVATSVSELPYPCFTYVLYVQTRARTPARTLFNRTFYR